MSWGKSRVVGLATATSMMALAAPAFAQNNTTAATAAEDEGGNDVIVVTAQKREQNLQDVPISIAAFNEEGLETARLNSVENIDKLVTGLSTTPNSADANGVRINIRGVGTFDPQIGQDSRVAVYIDGVYLGRTQGLAFDSPDLVRAEVVKGPQGTLYGRNAVAGAVNLILAKPDTSDFSGKLSAEYGNFGHHKLSGALNIPLGDKVAARFSGTYSKQDGWVDNLGPGADFGGSERYSFRAAFGFDLSDDVRLDLSGDFSKAKTEPFFYQSVPGFTRPTAFFAASVPTVTGRQESATTSFTNETGDLSTRGINATLSWDFSDDHNLKVIAGYRAADAASFVALVPTANPFILNGIINADIVPGAPVASVNSAFSTAVNALVSLGLSTRPQLANVFTPRATPGPQTGLFLSPPGSANQLHDHSQFSLEATFSGGFGDGALDYTVGAYYYDEKTGNDPNQTRNPNDFSSLLLSLAALPNAISVALTPAAFLPFVATPAALANQLANVRNTGAAPLRIQTKAFALYGELTWNITDQLSITGGLRYSDEQKDGQGQPVSPFFFDTVNLIGGAIPANIGSIGFSVLDPTLIVQFKPSEDFLLYASYKESFRSGGFNQSAVSTVRTRPTDTFGPDFIFGRESITSYEAGFKADLLDNRLRFNGAAFYYDFKDQQQTAGTNALVATERVIVNTDEKVWGAEVEALFALTDSLSINAGYSWIDGNAGDVPNFLVLDGMGNPTVDVRSELQGTPEHSLVIGGSFDTQLSDTVKLFANANYSYKADQLLIPADKLRISSRNLVSARLGVDYEMKSGSVLTLSVWGENIFDDKYTIDSLPFETFAHRTVVFGQPATYGVTAKIAF